MARSIRILSSRDVDTILAQLDIDTLIDVHTARLFRTLAIASTIASTIANTSTSAKTVSVRVDGSEPEPEPEPEALFVHSPHRLALQAGTGSPSSGSGSGSGGFYTTLVMPSSVANYGTTVKLVSVPNPASPHPPHLHPPRGLPATTLVVDERTGAVKAVLNACPLNIRTALGEWCVFWFLFFIFTCYVLCLCERVNLVSHVSSLALLCWTVEFAASDVPLRSMLLRMAVF